MTKEPLRPIDGQRRPFRDDGLGGREDGGTGFGFTGGHFHENSSNEDFLKPALNALVWGTGVEVPEGGVKVVP